MSLNPAVSCRGHTVSAQFTFAVTKAQSQGQLHGCITLTVPKGLDLRRAMLLNVLSLS